MLVNNGLKRLLTTDAAKQLAKNGEDKDAHCNQLLWLHNSG